MPMQMGMGIGIGIGIGIGLGVGVGVGVGVVVMWTVVRVVMRCSSCMRDYCNVILIESCSSCSVKGLIGKTGW